MYYKKFKDIEISALGLVSLRLPAISENPLDWSILEAKRQYEILSKHHLPVWVMEPLKGGRLATRVFREDMGVPFLRVDTVARYVRQGWIYRFSSRAIMKSV